MRSRTLWAVGGLCVALLVAAPGYADDLVAPTMKAEDLIKEGKPAEAIALLTAYLSKNPDDLSALLLRGATYAQVGKPTEAVADYTAALAIDPNLAEVQATTCSLLYKLHRFDEARTACAKAIVLTPGDAATRTLLDRLGQPTPAPAARATAEPTAAITAPGHAKTDCTRDGLTGPVHTTATTYQSLKRQLDGSIDTSQSPVGSATYDRTCTMIESTQDTPDFVDDQHPQRLDATTVLLHSNMGDKLVRERYDASGNRVESWTTTKDGSFVDHSVYRYDAFGRVVRIDSFSPEGKPDGFTGFTRDSGGHVVREVIQFGDGRSVTETYTYEFDQYGNWTKEFESGNDPDSGVTEIVPTGILFRTITYYPA